ncbi:MAG: glutaminyl-peptide cyclotransferase [Flavobacterium sp.]
MKNYNLLSAILLSATIVGCGGSKKNEESAFSFDNSKFKAEYYIDDQLSLSLLNPENSKIDSIIYYVNDKKVASKKDLTAVSFDLKSQKLGYQNLKALVYADGNTSGEEVKSRIELVSNIQPKLMNYTIVNTYAHDVKSFTEGLEFFRDTLYESTGKNGESYFRKYDYKTGKVFKQVDLEQKYFGEGITIINGKIFQLTWEEKTGFIYNANTLKLEKTFTYDKDIEGWGMTNDGTYIYQSDGTEKIWRMDPKTQKMVDNINVYAGSAKIKQVNELEFINGKIYGNVWMKDALAVIDPTSGAVEGIIDLSGLRKLVSNPEAEALNGIAHNPKTKTIFVTGKNWNKMFEIKVQ